MEGGRNGGEREEWRGEGGMEGGGRDGGGGGGAMRGESGEIMEGQRGGVRRRDRKMEGRGYWRKRGKEGGTS